MKTIALIGNPNSGKTTLFNQLTGLNQKTGNWPGVTVEKKSGILKKSKKIVIDDLPGIYSLNTYSPEEIIARDYLLNSDVDLIVNIVDAQSLDRSLYLTLQLLELNKPVVLVVNMIDNLKKQNIHIDMEKLGDNLGIKVFGISALKNQGLDKLIQYLNCDSYLHKASQIEFNESVEQALAEIQNISDNSSRFTAIKLFERDSDMQKSLHLTQDKQNKINELVLKIEDDLDDDSETIVVNERYQFIDNVLKLTLTNKNRSLNNLSDKIDQVLTNKYLALPIFAFVMWLVYYISIQTVGTMGTDWLNDELFGKIVPDYVNGLFESWQVASWMQSLVIDGIIAGVGAVIGFIPQIFVLFFCLGILDDCGYMSRIAFVIDKIFRKFGLSGKSFIPILISTGCGIPGIMSSRIIENQKERFITIMTATFMPCSAKLPVIALIAGALFPENSYIAPSAYFLSMGVIILSAIFLKKLSFFAGQTSMFIMELPRYHLPLFKNIIFYAFDRSKAFLYKAGTIIFLMSVFIWFFSSFNFLNEFVEANGGSYELTFKMVDVEESMLADFGKSISFIFSPLGWGNWQGTIASLTGLVAKETIVSTFGILFHAGEVSEEGQEIWANIANTFTVYSGYSFLIFNLLCAPCIAAIGTIKREVIKTKWVVLAVCYQTITAYIVAMLFYHFALLIFEGIFNGYTILSFLFLLIIIFMLMRRVKIKQNHIQITIID